VAALIGSPVRHSLSPVILNAAFGAAGLDWVFVALEVAAADGEAAVAAVRTLELGGLSVTMPHKEAAYAAVDERSADAEALAAVNCVARRGDILVGHNTDGAGLIDSLRIDEGFEPGGRRCVVVGAGGAARAAVLALAGSGAADVAVVNRTESRAVRAAALAGPAGRVGTVADVATADLVVNATPVGMAGLAAPVVALVPGVEADADGRPPTVDPADDLPFDPDLLSPGQLLVDMIYNPFTTPLLGAARARGVVAVNGLGMLIHQAAHAFRHWTGEDPPLEAMSAAAVAGLRATGTIETD
jgi:shikimate dehydrogenase